MARGQNIGSGMEPVKLLECYFSLDYNVSVYEHCIEL